MKFLCADEDRQLLLPSGAQPIFKNRAGWAHDRLKRAGLSSSPKRGFWKATPEGIAFSLANPAPFSDELAEKLAMGYIDIRLKPPTLSPDGSNETAVAPLSAPDPIESPDDRLARAVEELRRSAETE